VAAGTLLVDFAAQQMERSFNQRITVLAPAISDDEEEVLRSRFAGLTGHDSYESLTIDMDQMAHAHDMTLPVPLL
jgi:hypothetical protein